jgi:hypothetical protein
MVPEDVISAVVKAADAAPFPYPQPMRDVHLRKFFVFKTGTVPCTQLETILIHAIERSCEELIAFFGWRAYTPEGPGSFIQLLQNFVQTGISSFRTAPCIVLITEERRFPPVEQESLAFAVSHLWMAAVSFGLGAHLVPGVSYLSRRSEFFQLVHLPPGKYAVMGVALGYPHDDLERGAEDTGREPDVTWLYDRPGQT